MTAGHDAVTFKGMIVKTAVALLMALVSMAAHAETFKGYQCTKDCSGHKAGYAWAQRKGITDASQCTGKSRSFVEGCIAYAEGK